MHLIYWKILFPSEKVPYMCQCFAIRYFHMYINYRIPLCVFLIAPFHIPSQEDYSATNKSCYLTCSLRI